MSTVDSNEERWLPHVEPQCFANLNYLELRSNMDIALTLWQKLQCIAVFAIGLRIIK